MTRYVCNFVPTYKTYIETKHENRDRLGPSKMGWAGYLLRRPRTCIFLMLCALSDNMGAFQQFVTFWKDSDRS